MAVLALFAWLVAGTAAARESGCPALKGVQQLWAQPQMRFLIFGEYHGTVETPAIFADAVCHALSTGRPVRVGIEYAEAEQPAIDRFMSFQTEAYEPSGPVFHDGRHSEAMFELLGRLRALRASGTRLEVFVFVPATRRLPDSSPTPYEQDMAARWVDQARADPRALIMVLVGRLHGLKRPFEGLSFTPAAAFLPAESAVSLQTTRPGGAIWACVGEGCGSTPWPPQGKPRPRGVYLDPGEGYDGRFSVGGPFAPSPPFATRDAAAPGLELSSQTRAIIAPVAEAIAEVRARHAELPPARDDAERLVRMGELDQAPRRVIMAIDFSKVPPTERASATRAAAEPIEAVDTQNQGALLAMAPPEGWFLRSRYGDKAAQAAFHIVQHSNRELWRRFLPVLEPLVATGEVAGTDYALMFDRLAIAEGRPQRYGSQFRCDNGRWRPYPLEAPDRVEEFRRGLGFIGTFAEMKQRFEAMPSCPQTASPPPPGMNVSD